MCMSPALNGSSEMQCFECSDAIEICHGLIFVLLAIHLGISWVGGGGGGIRASSRVQASASIRVAVLTLLKSFTGICV